MIDQKFITLARHTDKVRLVYKSNSCFIDRFNEEPKLKLQDQIKLQTEVGFECFCILSYSVKKLNFDPRLPASFQKRRREGNSLLMCFLYQFFETFTYSFLAFCKIQQMSLAMQCKSSSALDKKVRYFITLISYLDKLIAKLIF